jgi:hypothetical protein
VPVADVIESYKRVSRDPQFLERFYVRFFARDPDVPRRFEGVDMARVRFLVGRSVTLLLQHASGVERGTESLVEVARRHGPDDLDIPERLYEHWVEALVETVAEHDPQFGPELEAQWRDFLHREVDWFRRVGGAPHA